MKTEINITDNKIAKQVQNKKIALVSIEKRNYYNEGFFTMFQSYIEQLSHARLTGTEWSVLAQLLTKLDYANNVLITHKQISEALKIDKSNVTKAFGTLIKIGCVIKSDFGSVSTYKLNANFVWKGDGKYRSAAKKWQKTQIERAEQEAEQAKARKAGKRIVELEKLGVDYDSAFTQATIEVYKNETSQYMGEIIDEVEFYHTQYKAVEV